MSLTVRPQGRGAAHSVALVVFVLGLLLGAPPSHHGGSSTGSLWIGTFAAAGSDGTNTQAKTTVAAVTATPSVVASDASLSEEVSATLSLTYTASLFYGTSTPETTVTSAALPVTSNSTTPEATTTASLTETTETKLPEPQTTKDVNATTTLPSPSSTQTATTTMAIIPTETIITTAPTKVPTTVAPTAEPTTAPTTAVPDTTTTPTTRAPVTTLAPVSSSSIDEDTAIGSLWLMVVILSLLLLCIIGGTRRLRLASLAQAPVIVLRGFYEGERPSGIHSQSRTPAYATVPSWDNDEPLPTKGTTVVEMSAVDHPSLQMMGATKANWKSSQNRTDAANWSATHDVLSGEDLGPVVKSGMKLGGAKRQVRSELGGVPQASAGASAQPPQPPAAVIAQRGDESSEDWGW